MAPGVRGFVTLRTCVVCGRTNGAVTELAMSGCSVAGELARGLKLSCEACHSAGPLIIPSLHCFRASKGAGCARTRWS